LKNAQISTASEMALSSQPAARSASTSACVHADGVRVSFSVYSRSARVASSSPAVRQSAAKRSTHS
jgi:hypothetical protein